MHVVEATADDVESICDLLDLLFSQEAEFNPDRNKQRAAVRAIIAVPHVGRILVYREDGAIHGMVNLLFTISTAKGGTVAILDDFIVRPDRRGQGIGSTLLNAARDFCIREGCLRITLNTDLDNDGATRLYQRHGFHVMNMKTMHRQLDE